MSTLLRWTIGPTKPRGLAILKESISAAKKLYPEFNFVICYNQIEPKTLTGFGVPLYHNQPESLMIPADAGYNVHWKLYPPRLRLNSHEIFIDNDIVLTKRVPEIDAFLESDKALLYQGLNKLHGQYDPLVPAGMRVNSGIFGLPPNYDFKSELEKIIQNTSIPRWTDQFDEQGLVAATLAKNPYYMIPLTTIPIIENNWEFRSLTTEFCCGYHFVGANYNETHNQWDAYLKSKII